ncbi:MAG TPA: hypothetical protein VIC59_12365 [Gemmatimonadota bacterium]
MRVSLSFASLALAVTMQAPGALAQEPADESPERTFRAELYVIPDAAGSGGLKVDHLKERPADLGVWVKGTPQKVQTVTVNPGTDPEVFRHKDLTFRISGLYRGPQKDRMLLKVSFDQAGQAAVKEFMAGLDETVVVTFPMKGGGAFLALLVST